MRQPAGGKKIRQMSSHSGLLQSVEVESPLFAPSPPQVNPLDAIIIPASRRASSFDELIKLSARLGAQLVVICSKLAKIEDVAERVARTPGARGLIIEIPKNYRVPHVPSRTSGSAPSRPRWPPPSTPRPATFATAGTDQVTPDRRARLQRLPQQSWSRPGASSWLDRCLEGVTARTAVHICYGYGSAAVHRLEAAKRRTGPSTAAYSHSCASRASSSFRSNSRASGVDPAVLADAGDKDILYGCVDVSPAAPDATTQSSPTASGQVPPLRPRRARLYPCTDCGMAPIPRAAARAKLIALHAAATQVRASCLDPHPQCRRAERSAAIASSPTAPPLATTAPCYPRALPTMLPASPPRPRPGDKPHAKVPHRHRTDRRRACSPCRSPPDPRPPSSPGSTPPRRLRPPGQAVPTAPASALADPRCLQYNRPPRTPRGPRRHRRRLDALRPLQRRLGRRHRRRPRRLRRHVPPRRLPVSRLRRRRLPRHALPVPMAARTDGAIGRSASAWTARSPPPSPATPNRSALLPIAAIRARPLPHRPLAAGPVLTPTAATPIDRP